MLPEGMELDPVVMSTLPPSMQVISHGAQTVLVLDMISFLAMKLAMLAILACLLA